MDSIEKLVEYYNKSNEQNVYQADKIFFYSYPSVRCMNKQNHVIS